MSRPSSPHVAFVPAFAALYGMPGVEVQTAFKATKTGFDGIYVRQAAALHARS